MLCKRRAVTDEVIINIGKRMPHSLSIVHSSGDISTRAMQQFFGLMPELQVNLGETTPISCRLALVAQSVSAFGC